MNLLCVVRGAPVRMRLRLVKVQAGVLSGNHSSVSFGLPPNEGNIDRLPVSQIGLLSHVPLALPISIFRLSLRSTDRLRQFLFLCTETVYCLSQSPWTSLHRLFNIHFHGRQVNENEKQVLLQTIPTSLRPAPCTWQSTPDDPVTSPFNYLSPSDALCFSDMNM